MLLLLNDQHHFLVFVRSAISICCTPGVEYVPLSSGCIRFSFVTTFHHSQVIIFSKPERRTSSLSPFSLISAEVLVRAWGSSIAVPEPTVLAPYTSLVVVLVFLCFSTSCLQRLEGLTIHDARSSV